LSQRERRLAGLGSAVLAAALLWALAIQPALEEKDRLDKSIVKHRQDLTALQGLAQEYRALAAQGAALSGRREVQPTGFNLAGHVEGLIAAAQLKAQVATLQPLPPQGGPGGASRLALDLRLREAPLEKVIKLLHRLEQVDKALAVTRFTLTPTAKGVDLSLRLEALAKKPG
jgi:hypothetical protein